MITFLYIDGFNLYNRALKHTPYKWLDFRALANRLLDPENQVEQIRYFTSWVTGRGDPYRTVRQQTYLRALKLDPKISIHIGHFLSRPILRPLKGKDINDRNSYVWVHDTREKGSDVNLASNLVWDGARSAYDVAVVISKDTDLVEPIRIVTQEIKKPVGILCPDGSLSQPLKDVASFFRHIREKDLSASQFPPTLYSPKGRTITKPSSW
jgi:uncharacterized LabA/DUF88 family protein